MSLKLPSEIPTDVSINIFFYSFLKSFDVHGVKSETSQSSATEMIVKKYLIAKVVP